ncbi:Rv0361 family membrane protein [Mycolicibacterium arenosum]|uniref:DUF4878 domain-containing protein n=1 Tax=Mycolicibacterium arenosum TaxID=2952157 RepID=A0ABT1LYS7_9MYCO|nr:DUF4878 domain-containing protein [Mycolicibacterium sp. CAU 1645]MCP9272049.1 DUF4878 domain-containing protein [Mycolicibacterium sp. CAU 1645]
MSDDKPADASGDEPEEIEDKPTIAPFVGALAIVVLVVIGMFVIDALGGDDLTPEQLVSRAVIGQNDALQRQNYAAFRDYTCAAAQGDEASVIAAQRDSVEKNGERYVDDVADVRIDGERATAAVTYSFDKSRDDKKTSDVSLVKEDGSWKSCEV